MRTSLGVIYRLPEWSSSEARRESVLSRTRVLMKARGWEVPSAKGQNRKLVILALLLVVLLTASFLLVRFFPTAEKIGRRQKPLTEEDKESVKLVILRRISTSSKSSALESFEVFLPNA